MAVAAKQDGEQEGQYPVSYYHPIIPDLRFKVEYQAQPYRFMGGRFVANDPTEEEAVRRTISYYGKDKPERWKGDDMKREFTCRHCNFRTFNSNAQEDHQNARQH